MSLGDTYGQLSHVYDELGRYELARELGERGLAITSAGVGPDHPDVATALNKLGNVAADEGNVDAARTYYERALAIRERTGDDPLALADIVNNLGIMAYGEQHDDEALALFQRAVAIRQGLDGNDPDATLPMVSIGNILARRKDYVGALAQFRKSLALVETTLGKDHPYGSDALVGIAVCMRELGDLDASRASLERALAIRKAGARPEEIAEVQVELAKTAWASGHHEQALAFAREARPAYADSKASARELAELDAWLATHE